MKKIKILAVAHAKDFWGGANRSFYMVLSRLKKDYNIDIDVLIPGEGGEFQKELNKIGIRCFFRKPHKFPLSRYKKDGKDFLRKIRACMTLEVERYIGFKWAKLLKKNDYDLVYSNTRFSSVGAMIAKRLKKPHICHIRECNDNNIIYGRWSYKNIGKYSKKIILISKSLYDEATKDVPEEKLRLIYNGIEVNHNIKKHNILFNDKVNILLTARIDPVKGHDEAIKSISILKDRGYDNIKLYFAGSYQGSDKYKKELENLIDSLNLTKNVVFCGEVDDMISLREKMDIELMCSKKETFGRVTVEGMRSGLLMIGSNTGGTVEIIDNQKNGILYEQGNSKDLANKLEEVINHREKYRKIAEYAFEDSKTKFTAEQNVKQIYEVIQESLKN